MSSRLVFDDKIWIGKWVAQEVEQTSSWGSFYAMGIEDRGKILAGVVFNNFNGSNATAHIAVKHPTKLLPKLLRHACHYAFEHCGLNRLTGLVEADNERALAFDKKVIGFQEEFVMKKAGAQGQDMVVLVLWPENCRWL